MSDKKIRWNKEKNEFLKESRKVSFEEIDEAIKNLELIDIISHPNKEKYPNQRIYLIEIGNYIYEVPFVETDEEIFLKTIYPSRKFTKKYLKTKD